MTFAGFVPDAELRRLMGSARAFIFAVEEDFGITPLEAQSEGTPVLALGRGGARETIRTDGPAATGILFDTPTPAAISDTVRAFLDREDDFDPRDCYENAARFSAGRFEAEFTDFVRQKNDEFQSVLRSGFVKLDQGRRTILEAAD